MLLLHCVILQALETCSELGQGKTSMCRKWTTVWDLAGQILQKDCSLLWHRSVVVHFPGMCKELGLIPAWKKGRRKRKRIPLIVTWKINRKKTEVEEKFCLEQYYWLGVSQCTLCRAPEMQLAAYWMFYQMLDNCSDYIRSLMKSSTLREEYYYPHFTGENMSSVTQRAVKQQAGEH